MHKKYVTLLIFYLVLLCYHLQAQSTNPNCRWVGTVTSKYTNSDNSYYNQTLTGNVIFEYDTTNAGNVEIYKLTGGDMTWSITGGQVTENCYLNPNSISFNWSSVQRVDNDLAVYEDGLYAGYSSNVTLFHDPTAAYIDCSEDIGDYSVHPVATGIAIGENGGSILQNGAMIGSFKDIIGNSTHEYTWNLHKESNEDVKLEIESGDYDAWLPTAGINEDEKGNSITFNVKLVKPDGSTPCITAKKFVFKLSDVSAEPGVALNYPDFERAKDSYDLHFEEVPEGGTISEDKLTIETKGGTEAEGKIYSFDWGGWAILKVEAVMPDGDIITGYLSGHPEITDILLPKRKSNSKIADKWKQDNDAAALNDDNDGENVPAGDGHTGDGFTLYEEYRGFYEGNKHISGDPKKKDLFVYSSSFDYIPGIEYFKSLTSLNVHDMLNEDEFDVETREMNFNYNEGPHSTDQHGLFIDQTLDPGKSYSPIGPPKHVDTVNISITVTEQTDLILTVAHELGHSVRIPHHGPNNDKKRSWQTSLSGELTWEYKEDGLAVDVRREDESPYTRRLSQPYYVAVWGAQHSGFSDCLMRYNVAWIYVPGPGSGSNIRYVVERENNGLQLCTRQDDSAGGYNDLNRSPRPRHGNAVNGKCKDKICVNDKYH